MEFITLFYLTTRKINDIFNFRFIPNLKEYDNHFGVLLKKILEYHNEKDYISRDTELNRIIFSLRHLDIIRKYDERIYFEYLKCLKKQVNSDSFWGILFEVHTTAFLIEKNINFLKRESPDFIINDQIQIECTSVRLRKDTNKEDFNYKITSKINDKIKKGYCSKFTVIFIDITNIYYNLINSNLELDKTILIERVKNYIINLNIGSIILFITLHNHSSNRVENIYLRIDNDTIENNLTIFLDKFYPKGNITRNNYTITNEL